VQAGSPAASSELKPSDVIVAVDGQPVKDARDLSRRIAAVRPGTTVRLTVIRDGAERAFPLTLGRLPGDQASAQQPGRRAPRGEPAPETAPVTPRLGMSVEPAGRGEGMVVTEVDPSGPAAQRGIRPGDVILDVAGRSVSSLRDVREALTAARADGRRSALIRLRSGEGQRFVAIPLNPS
jgi:serine protease Do